MVWPSKIRQIHWYDPTQHLEKIILYKVSKFHQISVSGMAIIFCKKSAKIWILHFLAYLALCSLPFADLRIKILGSKIVLNKQENTNILYFAGRFFRILFGISMYMVPKRISCGIKCAFFSEIYRDKKTISILRDCV